MDDEVNDQVSPSLKQKVGDMPRAIYKAQDWHVDDGVASDGSGRKPNHPPVRRVFTAEYKPAFLAEYDSCTVNGEKGALLRREGLYGSRATSAPLRRWSITSAAASLQNSFGLHLAGVGAPGCHCRDLP
jgi:hypothetical protein